MQLPSGSAKPAGLAAYVVFHVYVFWILGIMFYLYKSKKPGGNETMYVFLLWFQVRLSLRGFGFIGVSGFSVNGLVSFLLEP